MLFRRPLRLRTIAETSPFEDPNGNLHHVFPFLRPDTQENAVADSAVSPVPFPASDEVFRRGHF